jgi:hypothetical protein
MIMFRNETGIRIFSLLTAVIFLNMSFFLAEVCMLEIKDRNMVENVANMVLNAGLEEERDAHTHGSDAPLKMFSLSSAELQLRHSSLVLIASRIHQELINHYRHADHSERFSPPPEVIPQV